MAAAPTSAMRSGVTSNDSPNVKTSSSGETLENKTATSGPPH